jgi:hypothetical protein
MKAIEKDTTRRYPSASDMGNDIRRHLSDEPVIAAKPGFGYRIEKCIRANRPLISAVLAGMGAVLSFLNFLLCIGGFGGPYISRILGTPYSNIRKESRVSLRASHVAVIAATLTVILIVLLAILTFVSLAYIRVLRDQRN